MFNKIFDLKKALDKKAKAQRSSAANFIVVGDMNTMGLDYGGKNFDISSADEINQITSKFNRRGMKMLKKSHPDTFNNGSISKYEPSALDHVFAAKHLRFADMDNNGAEILVGGWTQKNTEAEQDKWIAQYSDHAPIVLKLVI